MRTHNSSAETKKLAMLAMLSAVAFVALYLSKLIPISVAGFLNFDLKDTFIVIAGFIFGPLPALAITVVVSLVEMVTISTTGPIGLIMNVLSSGMFSVSAALIYKKLHTQRGAVYGLLCAVLCTTAVMLLWNYLITPLYMKVSREMVAGMLLSVFLPFNLVKYAINAALTLLIYKPLVKSLRKAKLLPPSKGSGGASGKSIVMIFAAVLLVTCILLALVLAGVL